MISKGSGTMPMFSGPIETLLVAGALVAAVAGWVLRRRERRRYRGPRLVGEGEREPIDREVLDAAEREVRDLGVSHDPEDGFEGDDWGPGAARRPRSPLEL